MSKADKFLYARLDEIAVDRTWNARSAFEETEDVESVQIETSGIAANSQHTSDASTGIGGTTSSIETRGQDTPIVIRPNPVGGKKPYSLVAGFQRFETISRLNHDKKVIPGLEAGHIKAILREMTEAEAQEVNVAENSARNELSAPDLMFGIARVRDTWAAASLKLTQVELGRKFAITGAYVGMLLVINDNVDPKILHDWRRATRKLTVKEMTEVAKLDRKDQRAAYNALERPVDQTPEEDAADKKRKKFKSAEKNALAVGTKFGNIVRDGGLLATDIDADFFSEYLFHFVTISDKFTQNQCEKLTDAAMKGFEIGQEAEVEETEEEGDAPKKSSSKKKNGAKQVSAN